MIIYVVLFKLIYSVVSKCRFLKSDGQTEIKTNRSRQGKSSLLPISCLKMEWNGMQLILKPRIVTSHT